MITLSSDQFTKYILNFTTLSYLDSLLQFTLDGMVPQLLKISMKL